MRLDFGRVIMRNGINVNDDGESVEKRTSALLFLFRHPQRIRRQKNEEPQHSSSSAQLSGSMWNVPATESIRKHCFNGQGHKSLSPPISTISDTHAFRPLASSPRLDLNWGIWDGSR